MQTIDIYQVTRRNGITANIEIHLNNHIFQMAKTEVVQHIVNGLNKASRDIINPFISAHFIKRTIK